ncbi:MAG: nuclear transport factor 2 family protein [Bacteroidales bacterium]|nr:nuclear transport factor 2 family protein [Bacteroidales bacterium]MCD4773071.1 nuclear transport factor 2 family protein [Bacteroidales bacterium]
MKKFILLLFTVFFIGLTGCNECEKKEPAINLEEEKLQIENILDQYVIANENKDLSIIEKIWANEDDIVLIGTDSDEKLIGWKQIKNAIQHQFKSFEDVYISVSEQMIFVNETGNTAWFSEILSYNFIYNGEAMSFEGIRFTGVLEKSTDWEIVQGHLSIPAEVDIETNK